MDRTIRQRRSKLEQNIYQSLTGNKDIQLQNFKYKCLMRIILTNKYFLKCKIGETALCEFCTMEIDNINHLFGKYVQHVWANLTTFLLRYNITMHLSLKYVTFGITDRTHCIEKNRSNNSLYCSEYTLYLKTNALKLNQQ